MANPVFCLSMVISQGEKGLFSSDYNADQNDLCDDKTMLKMQREQRKRADKENRERRGRVFWTTEKPIKITCTIFQRKKVFEKSGRS
ncbi:unnamed protein product [Brassica oleracea]